MNFFSRLLHRDRTMVSCLATVAQNEEPKPTTIAEALAVGALVVDSVCDRETIINSNRRIDPAFAMPAANWETSTSDYISAYRLLASLEWPEIRILRLRAQNFTGKNLVIMGDGAGLHALDVIPSGFERNWSNQKRGEVVKHWRTLTDGLPRRLVLRAPNILGEAGWWINGTLVNVDVVDYQERINLLNLAGLIDRFAGKDVRVLEIGGGYGALAYSLASILGPSQYVICDLPESLLFSGLYLSIARDDPARLLALDEDPKPLRAGEICLLPNYLAQTALLGQHFDLVINTLSMSEMSARQVSMYGALISSAIGKSGVFFEQNHDNRHLGLLDCREYLAPLFRNKTVVDLAGMLTTRGTPIVWSN